jgi:hypothetical protein
MSEGEGTTVSAVKRMGLPLSVASRANSGREEIRRSADQLDAALGSG